MTKQKIILMVIVLILVVGNVYFCFRNINIQKELRQAQVVLGAEKINENILEFAKLFIKEVLKAKTEVSFETRLKLENLVRDLGDEEILVQWQKFTESKTENDAQENVKNLLELLIDKIHPIK